MLTFEIKFVEIDCAIAYTMANANAPTARLGFEGPPAPLIVLPPEQHPDERLRTDLGPAVDAIPNNAPTNTPLIGGPAVNNNLLTMATLAHFIPNITIGQIV
jgi:hypothetical protein